MEVTIIKTDSEKIVAVYPIKIGGLNYTPSDEEYYSSAWKCAVEDKVVDSDTRDQHSFILRK